MYITLPDPAHAHSLTAVRPYRLFGPHTAKQLFSDTTKRFLLTLHTSLNPNDLATVRIVGPSFSLSVQRL